ncbi:MAG: YceI family protein [Bdellovibrionota bacterium]
MQRAKCVSEGKASDKVGNAKYQRLGGKMKKLFITLLLTMPLASFANVKSYEIDTDHSIVSFKIGHLIGKVRGSFSGFSGEIKLDENNLKNFRQQAISMLIR